MSESSIIISKLVINAQTGQIEPYVDKKQGAAYCPRVITWEEVH